MVNEYFSYEIIECDGVPFIVIKNCSKDSGEGLYVINHMNIKEREKECARLVNYLNEQEHRINYLENEISRLKDKNVSDLLDVRNFIEY